MPPCRGVVAARRVELRECGVRRSELRVQLYGVQHQPERFVLAPLHAIELRQMQIGPRVTRLARDPCQLLLHVFARFGIEGRLDHVLAPETHCAAPTRKMRTSITLVFVGPVITRSWSG